MKTKDIILRKSLTSSNLRIRLDVLFRTHEFKSNYINAHVQIILNNENVINLNEQMVFNVTSKEEVKTFIQSNENSFSNIFKKNRNVSARKIILYYIESDKEAYDKYLELNQKNLKTDINSPFNINTRLYSTFSKLGKRFYSTNSKSKYSFQNIEYPISESTILTDLQPYFDRFINENKINFDNYISVICQVREVGNVYYTIGDRFPIDLNKPQDLTDYLDYIQNKWVMLDSNQYNPNLAMSILFNYTNTTVDNYSLVSNKLKILQNRGNIVVNFEEESPLGLPLNINYTTWGTNMLILSDGRTRINNLYSDLKLKINRYIEIVNLSKFDTEVNIYSSESNIKLKTFIDKILNNNEFIRFSGNKTYYIKDNKLYFIFDKLITDQFIKRDKPSKNFIFNIMTLDVETYVDEFNQMNIYCVSMYDGVEAKSFYLTDYNDIHSLINEVLKTIFTKKYSGKSIYIHNSSEFDMIFLYSYLINFYDLFIQLSHKFFVYLRES